MPDRPGVDDNDSLKRLIGLWRDGEADLAARQNQIWRSIVRELGKSDPNQIRVDRLKLAAGRLDELAGVASAIADDLADETKTWIEKNGMVDIYGAGVLRVAPFSYTIPHRAAVEVLADDLYDDVLKLTQHIDDGAKSWVRRVGRELTGFKLTGGQAVKAQARRFESELRHEFVGRGITAVTYRDGSRHGFGEYAEMLLRTKTAVAYNVGTLNQTRGLGIQFVEILDGALCGLTAHEDTQLANGMIVPVEIAAAFPIAHPNCRRSLNPRPDVTPENLSQAKSVQSDEARADQKAWEAYLRAQQKATRGSRSGLTGRKQKGGTLTGRKPTGPTGGQRAALTGKQAKPAAPPKPNLAQFNVNSGERHDFRAAVHGRTQEFLDVDAGPVDPDAGRPGPGVAFVDDQGRLFYWEKPPNWTREDVIGRMKDLMKENARSLPEGVEGARAHVVVQGRSLSDQALSQRYGRQFMTAANANSRRVAYFGGEFRRSTVWHENGHVVATEINRRLSERTLALSGNMGERIKVIRAERGLKPNTPEWEGVHAELIAELDKVRNSGFGDSTSPMEIGTRWTQAMQADTDRLLATNSKGVTFADRKLKDFDGANEGHYVNNTGQGIGADGVLRNGVTDYGGTNPAEDFAESWRLRIQDRVTGGIASHREGKFLKVTRWDYLFQNRAQALDEVLDLVGMTLED